MPVLLVRETIKNGEFFVGDVLDVLRSMPSLSVDAIFTSPPYPGKMGRYEGLTKEERKRLNSIVWHEWMIEVAKECSRISKGYSFFVVNGTVEDGEYDGEPEFFIGGAKRAGLCLDRPCIWHKNSPPNRMNYLSNDWEYIVSIKNPLAIKSKSNKTPKEIFFDWEKIGTPPKYKTGGKFRQRNANGERREGGDYPTNPITRPRDVIRATVGGGHLGSKLAHRTEAPFPESLVEYFVKAFVPEGGIVLDPFIGGGTVAAVAERLGMRWVGVDNRESQLDATKERVNSLGDVT